MDSRKSDMKRISRSAGQAACVRRLAEVRLEQRCLGVLVQAVVHGQVAQVEVAVAHPRVLPVDDAEPLAVERAGCRPAGRCGRGRARARARAAPSRSPSPACAPRGSRPGAAAPRSEAVSRVGLHDPERGEGRRQLLAAVVDLAQRAAPPSHSMPGSRSCSSVDRSPVHERGHEDRRVLEHRAHRRAHPGAGRRAGRRPLRAAVDAEQVGVLAGLADHVRLRRRSSPCSCGW